MYSDALEGFGHAAFGQCAVIATVGRLTRHFSYCNSISIGTLPVVVVGQSDSFVYGKRSLPTTD